MLPEPLMSPGSVANRAGSNQDASRRSAFAKIGAAPGLTSTRPTYAVPRSDAEADTAAPRARQRPLATSVRRGPSVSARTPAGTGIAP
jgi:hypothetical protein